jgi:DNA-binding NarL/FixJ family response regulator
MTVRVCLVDDHPLFRDGLKVALAEAELIEVVAEADSGQEALSVVAGLQPLPDIVLLGVRLPEYSGVEVARSITAGRLGDGSSPRIIMLSAVAEDHLVVEALRLGVLGYLLKGASREELVRAIRIVADGGAVFSPSIAKRLPDYFGKIHDVPGRLAFPDLTERERQVLDLIARGYGNRQIARELVLAEKTVRNHITHLFVKLKVNDRSEATLRARDAGLGM